MEGPQLIVLCLVLLACVAVNVRAADIHHGKELVRVKRFQIPFFWKGAKGKDTSEYVTFRLFTRNTLDSPEVVDSRNLHPFKTLIPGKPVKMVIHGWKGYDNDTFTKAMKKGLLEHDDLNLITVDWSGYGSRSNLYPVARNNVPEVAFVVGSFLDLLADSKIINLDSLQVLGHSLGGQIAGIAGQLVKGKIGRVTGFDPAGPYFKLEDVSGRLSTGSAKFVDVIHTTSNLLGFGAPIGHVDFYPNGGHAIQPGCGMDIIARCSHRRSYQLYLESLSHPDGFPAVTCVNWEHFKKNECDKNESVNMGIKTPATARGVYFLQTNKETPFNRDTAGVYYDP